MPPKKLTKSVSSDDSDDSEDEDFEFVTILKEAGRMTAGSLLMMRGTIPCKVIRSWRGSAQIEVTGKDIFTDKLYEECFKLGTMIPVPVIETEEYLVRCLDDDVLLLESLKDSEMVRRGLTLPKEKHLANIKKNIVSLCAQKRKVFVTVQDWEDQVQVCAVRDGGKK